MTDEVGSSLRPAYLLFFSVEGFELQRRVLLLRQLQVRQREAEI